MANGFIAHHLHRLAWQTSCRTRRRGDSTARGSEFHLPYDGRHPVPRLSEFRRRVAVLRAASRAGIADLVQRSQSRVTRRRSGDYLRRHACALCWFCLRLLDTRLQMAWPHRSMHVSTLNTVGAETGSTAGFWVVSDAVIALAKPGPPGARRFFVTKSHGVHRQSLISNPITPRSRNFSIMRRQSASRKGQIESIDWMSHEPLMRDSIKPSCGSSPGCQAQPARYATAAQSAASEPVVV